MGKTIMNDAKKKQPNILWIMAEDMCPNLGCYGDTDAITPNLDRLASNGVRYDHVSSVGPVCSAARTTLALGMYPQSVGTGNHRSEVRLPEYVKIFSQYLQEEGYYTGINKTDYNFKYQMENGCIKGWDTTIKGDIWDDSEALPEALASTWRQRDEGQPFFMMHTFACTHQSRYGFPSTPEEHRKMIVPRTKAEEYRDRSLLHIPTYHPDTPETREIWGQYHETITAMDRMVGETIEKLKEDGIYEETIIFFMGDNGMGIPSGKFSMWNEGTNVPLIVRIPDKYKHLAGNYNAGSVETSGVCFVDLPLTTLKLAGATVPDYMQGKDFLSGDRDYVNETYSYRNRIDSSCEVVRSVKNAQYMYIRNFYPHKGWRFSPYIVTSGPYFTSAWEKAVKDQCGDGDEINRLNCFYMPRKPIEELYDLENDPDQMNNLATVLEHESTLLDLRAKLQQWMVTSRDGGLIPEHTLKHMAVGSTTYDVIHDELAYPIERILEVCDSMLEDTEGISSFMNLLDDENSAVRFWAVQGIYAKGMMTKELRSSLIKALNDPAEMVQLAAAETLISFVDDIEEVPEAKAILIKYLKDESDVLLPLEASDCMDRLGDKVKGLVPYLERLVQADQITNEEGATRYLAAITGVASYVADKAGKFYEDLDPNNHNTPKRQELRRLATWGRE